MSDKKRKRQYYPNNWQVIKDAPIELFEQLDFEDVADKNWLLRPGAKAIIRAQSLKTGRVKEFVYKQEGRCMQRLSAMRDTHELTLLTDDIICSNYEPNAD